MKRAAVPRRGENRDEAFDRDGGICRYCGDEATEVDHIVPWQLTFDSSLDNLAAACSPCNRAGGADAFASFDEKRAAILLRRRAEAMVLPREPLIVIGASCSQLVDAFGRRVFPDEETSRRGMAERMILLAHRWAEGREAERPRVALLRERQRRQMVIEPIYDLDEEDRRPLTVDEWVAAQLRDIR